MTLAQRMIVMNAGRAEQIGTPMEVYENPATLFVAGFIGSPAMNFLPGKSDGDGRVALDGGGTVPRRRRTRRRPRGHRRHPARAPGAATDARADRSAGSVEMVEELGADTLRPSCHVAGAPIVMRTPHDVAAPVGEAVALAAAARSCLPVRRRERCAGAPSEPPAMPGSPGRIHATSRIAAPASWRPRTRWPRCASATRTATGWSNSTSSSRPTTCRFCCTTTTLDRTTSGRGRADALTWRELARLDAGGWHSREVRRRAAAHARGDRALGASPTTSRATSRSSPRRGASAKPALPSRWTRARCGGTRDVPPLLSSFSEDALEAAREAAPELPRALLLDELPPDWKERLARARMRRARSTPSRRLDAALVADAHRGGLSRRLLHAERCRARRRARAWGVDGIVPMRSITDAIDLIRPPTLAALVTRRGRGDSRPALRALDRLVPLRHERRCARSRDIAGSNRRSTCQFAAMSAVVLSSSRPPVPRGRRRRAPSSPSTLRANDRHAEQVRLKLHEQIVGRRAAVDAELRQL